MIIGMGRRLLFFNQKKDGTGLLLGISVAIFVAWTLICEASCFH